MDIENPNPTEPICEENEDEYSERGSAASFAAVFQKRGSLFTMTNFTDEDYEKAELESKKFSAKNVKTNSKGSQGKKKKGKRASENDDPAAKTLPQVQEPTSTNVYAEAELLNMEFDQTLRNDDGLLRRNSQYDQDSMNMDKTKPSSNSVLMEVELTDSDYDMQESVINSQTPNNNDNCRLDKVDEGVGSELNDSQNSLAELGEMVAFSISLNGILYSVMIYENEFIEDLRKAVAQRSGTPEPESIQMFFGTMILEDGKTVKESRLPFNSSIDAFITTKSDQELFEEGSASILKFRLQTSDQRGRQNRDIYVKMSAQMRVVRDKYATEMGLDASKLKLMFDGEVINLDNSPEDCDLEGDEMIDVVIINSENSAEPNPTNEIEIE